MNADTTTTSRARFTVLLRPDSRSPSLLEITQVLQDFTERFGRDQAAKWLMTREQLEHLGMQMFVEQGSPEKVQRFMGLRVELAAQ